jgi:hypothetical protein
MNGGYIKLWRVWLEHPIFQSVPTSWGRIALSILLRANWKARKWNDGTQDVEIPAGSLATSSEKLAALARTTRQQARSALDYLESSGFITSRRTNRYTLITVCNWGVYQGDDSAGNQQNNQQNEQITTKQPAKQPADNQQPNANEDGPSEHVSEPNNRGKQPAKQPQNNHNRRRESSSRREEKEVLRPKIPVICGKPSEPENKNTSSFEADDDETATPKERLERYISRKHPDCDAAEIVRLVHEDLEGRGYQLTVECLQFIRENSNGKSITNPPGLYRKLAGKFAGKLIVAGAERDMAMRDAMKHGVKAPAFKPQCDACNDGLLASGGFCGCKVGALRRLMAEHVSGDKREATA